MHIGSNLVLGRVASVLVFATLFGTACSESRDDGPCVELLACCEGLEPTAQAQCRDSYETYRTHDEADAYCAMAIDAFTRAGVVCGSDRENDAGVQLLDDGGSDRRDAGWSPGSENTRALCSDGVSNDGDRFIDCDDYDCCDLALCASSSACGGRDAGTVDECAEGPEDTALACSDGCSNDRDSIADCDDFDCCDVVACPATSACGARDAEFVSLDVADCVGTGTVSYLFDGTTYDVVTIAIASSAGYTVFGYTRDAIESGPFPLVGTAGERQIRVGPWDGGLALAFAPWDGSGWNGSEGGAASYSDDSTVSLATDAESRYATHACVGVARGSATAPVLGGVDQILFEFTAPVIGRGFPGI